MEYALQLLLPILGGLLLGQWLHDRFGASSIWTVILAILGMVAGLGLIYKRQMLELAQQNQKQKSSGNQTHDNQEDDSDP